MRSAGLLLLLTIAGCNDDRLAKLEKQNADLQQQVTQLHQANQLDLQAKCGKDSKTWFDDNWATGRDKDTMLLDYTNHYNKAQNGCFIVVEYHYSLSFVSGFINNMTLYNVYENDKLAEISETHAVSDAVSITRCRIQGHDCKTRAEFDTFVGPYIVN